ncbi:peptide/nickel transport system ATP-binding protein [Bacillus mesophilus]|uniref:ABC transporter ATP-binding protein n=1 Tax=Bacillus mesophilus TaxID=1808955 RepID=A0A6M0Q858_9BACI|nr:ABC transporter ATP-binding protein [Bacillus mesophilus]MBM7662133.1 peptide/nickel transport system ATP-binding protein [Bacillus mesophilus]NEY72514.1 ABC transporter ATP-binding protein [Bacillus mesophilus]
MALLEVKNLEIYYQTKRGTSKAVDDVSFELEQGKSIGIVGESGCGKSTLVKGIIRVMAKNGSINNGEVLFNGKDLTKISEQEIRSIRWKELSLIPQAAMDSLNPVYPVLDAFVEILTLKGNMKKKQAVERAKELFDMVGLDQKRLTYYPHEFSGGMKQRAVIALALALNPKLIIADEPVTALDVIVQDQVLKELTRLREQLGISLILITHDISVVAQTCESIAVMYAGKIVEKGLARNVLKNPTHPYTMGLANAFPNLKEPDKPLISIEGSPPDLVDPPTGCRFAERCPFKIAQCTQEEPKLVEVEVGHFSACHRLAEIDELREKSKEVSTWEKVMS